MGTTVSLTSPPCAPNSLVSYAPANVRKAMTDRMAYSEAVEGVGKLVAAFPNGSPANAKGYIGALAAVLADYPRVIAAKCCDPLKGVARDTRFLPTVADLVGWCERELAELRAIVDRDDFEKACAQQQRDLRAAEQKLADDRKLRPTLQQLQEQHGTNWGIQDQQEMRAKTASTDLLLEANRRTFERECRRAGVDPTTATVSPELVRLLDAKDPELAERRAARAAAQVAAE